MCSVEARYPCRSSSLRFPHCPGHFSPREGTLHSNTPLAQQMRVTAPRERDSSITGCAGHVTRSCDPHPDGAQHTSLQQHRRPSLYRVLFLAAQSAQSPNPIGLQVWSSGSPGKASQRERAVAFPLLRSVTNPISRVTGTRLPPCGVTWQAKFPV